jgi:heat shock protein HtpX
MDPPGGGAGHVHGSRRLQGIRSGAASLAALRPDRLPANRFGGFGKMYCMAPTSSFGKDTGLQVRMVVTLFLLGALYAVLLAALFASGASGITILVVAGGLLALQLFTSDKIALRAMGVHEVSPQQAPELHAMIERLCIQADLPKPRIGVMESQMPNAFAMGRSKKAATVCATTGIMELLSPAELEGVMAHELSHIANRDVMIMTLASFFASLASMIVQFGFFFGGGGDDDDDSPGILGLIAVSLIVYVISFFLMQALSRYREFAADRGSAIITGRPSALASALMKIAGTMERVPQQDLRAHAEMNAFYIFPAGAKRSLFNLFSTHPPLEKRIAALQRLETQLQRGGGAALAA